MLAVRSYSHDVTGIVYAIFSRMLTFEAPFGIPLVMEDRHGAFIGHMFKTKNRNHSINNAKNLGYDR